LRFESPLALLSLLLVPAILAAYVVARRRRPRYAVNFTNLEVLRGVSRPLSALRQHAVTALAVTTLALLCVGVARPQVKRVVTVEDATVILVVDTSRSMLSSDVAPTRLAAAKQAAQAFLDRAPDRLRVGLVTFAGDVTVAAFPTHDREQVRSSVAAISRWNAGGGTAIGDALVRAVELAGDAFGERGLATTRTGGDDHESPVTILFLSDGRQNRGIVPPEAGADFAKRAGISIFTVALGTDRPDGPGSGQGGFGFGGGFNRTPDRATLRAIASTTGGEYFAARSAEAVSSAYHDLGSRLGRAKRETEVTHLFVAAAGIALAAAAALSRLWAPGLP
jgi:Ca-activated chloride channel family protein